MKMKIGVIGLAAALSLVADQLSKFVVSHLVVLQINSGISWSWLPGKNQLEMAGLLSLFLIGIAWSWRRVWVAHPIWSGIFFGAAISNILDRILYDGVRDWLTVPGLHLKNNLADWLVCLSLAMIVWRMFKQKKLAVTDRKI